MKNEKKLLKRDPQDEVEVLVNEKKSLFLAVMPPEMRIEKAKDLLRRMDAVLRVNPDAQLADARDDIPWRIDTLSRWTAKIA